MVLLGPGDEVLGGSGMGVVGRRLRELADAHYARQVQRLFKTGPGDYGEGDVFIGVRVPAVRALAKEYGGLGAREVRGLIRSEIHEERLLGLLILLEQYRLAEQTGNCSRQLTLYRIYCGHFKYINNWDLVDATCPHIVGKYLCHRPHGVLLEWARHRHLWTRRIAVVSTWWFIRQGKVNTTLRVAHCLVDDEHRSHPQGSGLDAPGGGQEGLCPG